VARNVIDLNLPDCDIQMKLFFAEASVGHARQLKKGRISFSSYCCPHQGTATILVTAVTRIVAIEWRNLEQATQVLTPGGL
jgi:hypothetical protein